MFDEDAVFSDALFLVNHPAWAPRDLAQASEELIDTMILIENAVTTARERAQRQANRGQSRAAQVAAQSRRRR